MSAEAAPVNLGIEGLPALEAIRGLVTGAWDIARDGLHRVAGYLHSEQETGPTAVTEVPQIPLTGGIFFVKESKTAPGRGISNEEAKGANQAQTIREAAEAAAETQRLAELAEFTRQKTQYSGAVDNTKATQEKAT